MVSLADVASAVRVMLTFRNGMHNTEIRVSLIAKLGFYYGVVH